MKTRSIHIVPVCLFAFVALGSGCAETSIMDEESIASAEQALSANEYTFPISPRGDFHKNSTGVTPALSIDLAAEGIDVGDTLHLEQIGDFSYVGWENEGWLLGVFSAGNTLLADTQDHRVPGAVAVPGVSGYVAGLGNDIPEHFGISRLFHRPWASPSLNFNGVDLVVPAGATHLFVANLDNYYGDNPMTDDDLAVRITRLATADLPPDCSAAAPSVATLWSPNHQLVPVTIGEIVDPEGGAITVRIGGVFQDEALDEGSSGSTGPDAFVQDGGTVLLRAERSGSGDGRVYTINFTAEDEGGASCSGVARVTVPHNRKQAAVDGGALYRSTGE